MDLDTLRSEYRDAILAITQKYGADNVRVFGSVARGEAGPDSDVDLLVHMRPGSSLFDLGGIYSELTTLLHCKVDIVSEKAVSPRLKDAIFKEATAL